MSHLSTLIRGRAQPQELASWLDSLSHAQRLEQVLVLNRADQRALFDLVQGAHPLTLEHYVPAQVPPMQEVIHWGLNTLPAFRRFQKRFCRPPASYGGDVLWGYNEQVMKAVTGPGYFHARPGAPDTPVWIDYRGEPPADKPVQWPEMLHNGQKLSRVIYFETIDKMRKVSHHVSVGSAFRGDKALGAYFLLVREDAGK
jgi:hypothetical protein